MASSAIGFINISYGRTGPTGDRGTQGATGPDGITGNAIGPIGPNAPYIDQINFYSSGATVVLSDSTEFGVLGNFKGQTATEYSKVIVFDPFQPETDSATFSFISSGHNTNSFVMRGISGSGSLVVTEDSEAIYIDSIYTPDSGSADSAGLTDNTLIFLKKSNQVSSTTIGVTYGNFYNGTLNFERSSSTPSFSKLLPRAKVKYLQPIFKTSSSVPQSINVDDAGVFYVRTPNGISGFSGSFNNSEIVSFTLIVESDDIWNFPTNVYFENGENYLTCGKSIINLSSFDKGNSWYAVVSARGVDATATNCGVKSLIGSCCYYDDIGNLLCDDFITRNQCDALAGSFNPLQSCETACGITAGVCCSNGTCIENTNYSECIAFGGRYYYGITCGYLNNNPNGDNSTRLCYDKCQNQKVACCKNGECIGDEYTKFECENILGGIAFVGNSCPTVDCCLQNVRSGACCIEGTCQQKTLLECQAQSGVFLGEGEACDTVNCSCYASTDLIYGACCLCSAPNTVGCIITTQQNCTSGVWQEIPGSNPTDNCMSIAQASAFCNAEYTDDCADPLVKCCRCVSGTTTCTEVLQSVCTSQGGISSPLTSGNCTSTPCNPCANYGGSPCGDCNPAQPGRKCKCVANGDGTTSITCTDVTIGGSGADPECLNSTTGVICTPGNCLTATPSCAELLSASCSQTFCVTTVPETTTCPDINVIPSDSCVDCISDSSTTINSGRSSDDMSGTNYLTAQFVAQLLYTPIPTPPNCAVQARPIPEYTQDVQDYYIPIKPEYICSNGTDLQFCIEIDIPQNSVNLQSFRAYVLRTWYPKYYSTNYAALYSHKYLDGSIITKINPAQNGVERSVWGSIDQVRGLTYMNIEGGQAAPDQLYADNLGSFLGEDGYNYINYQEDITSLDNGTNINMNTARLIEELNCPLFGYNPRGRELGFQNSGGLYDSLNPSTPQPAPNSALASTDGYLYPLANQHGNTFYYSSTNIGGRFGTTNPTISSVYSSPEKINWQSYINTSGTITQSKLSYLAKSRAIQPVNPSPDLTETVVIDNSLTSVSKRSLEYLNAKRTYGYTDGGFVSVCTAGIGYSSMPLHLKHIAAPHKDLDTYEINGIGYYIKNATFNRFANRFFNDRFVLSSVGGNNPDAQRLIKYGLSYTGHPIMVDFESNVVFEPGNAFSPGKNVFRYDSYNSEFDGGNFVNAMDFNTLSGTYTVKKSPIYKTKRSAIICDTGAMDSHGNYYEDSSFSGPGAHLLPTYLTKRKYVGAVGDPFTPLPIPPVNPAYNYGAANPDAESIITKTPSGIKICIKLKNYKNFILTDDQITGVDYSADEYNRLKDPTILRNKRIHNYKNTLRLVLFKNPINPYSANIKFDSSLPNPFSEYKVAADEYLKNYKNATGSFGNPTTSPVGFTNTLKYSCQNSSCNCSTYSQEPCDSCNILADDKVTNAYAIYPEHILYCILINGYRIRAETTCCGAQITPDSPGGEGGPPPGSYYVCTCDNNEPCIDANVNIGFPVGSNCRNCNDDTPCSCKTAVLHGDAIIPGMGVPCTAPEVCPESLCKNCCDNIEAWPGIFPYIISLTDNFGCGCGSNICIGTGYYTDLQFRKNYRRNIIAAYFRNLGYTRDTDYFIFAGTPLPDGNDKTVVAFKLPPRRINTPVPHERYGLSKVAPPYLIRGWNFGFPTSDPSAFNSTGYIRNLICKGNSDSTESSLHQYIPYCAINEPIANGVLYNAQCSNYCITPGQVCSVNFDTEVSGQTPTVPPTLVDEIFNQALNSPFPGSDLLGSMGDVCSPASPFTAPTYKKFFIDETKFVCVNVDCSTIDCSQYQDCIPS